MKILVIHAHENPNSFCSAVASQTQSILSELGHKVSISDLYKMNFNPVGSKADFDELSDNDYYKYAMQQLHASKNNAFSIALSNEMEKLVEADVLIFNFPLWWFGMPAILKGWVDRVMAYGVAYGGDYGFRSEGRFAGKQAMLSVTTGSPESFYHADGMHGRSIDSILQNMHEGILQLVGYTTLSPFVSYAVSRATEEDRLTILESHSLHLKKLFS